MPTPTIDWSKVPATGKAQPAKGNNSNIDWSKVQSQPNPANFAQAGPVQHPTENRIGEMIEDIKHGPGKNDDRFFPSLLRTIGFQGLDNGTGGGSGGVGETIGGPVLGPFEMTHAASRVPQVRSVRGAENVANEAIKGGFHTLSAVPLAAPAALPMMVPAATIGGLTSKAASTGAKVLGADPDTQELVGNVAAGAIPLGHEAASPVGRFIENNASTIGNTAAAVAAGSRFLKTGNPLNLALLHPSVTRPVTKVASGVGKALQAVGETPLIDTRDSKAAESIENPVSANDYGVHPANSKLALPRGAIQVPPPELAPESIAQPAASQVVRGSKGRMTKQFLTSTDQGNGTQYGSQPPLIQTFGSPKEPPPLYDPEAVEITEPQAVVDKQNKISEQRRDEATQFPRQTSLADRISTLSPETRQNLIDLAPQMTERQLQNAGIDSSAGIPKPSARNFIDPLESESPIINNDMSNSNRLGARHIAGDYSIKPSLELSNSIRDLLKPNGQDIDYEGTNAPSNYKPLIYDYSNLKPIEGYHGSESRDLIDTGISARIPRDMDETGLSDEEKENIRSEFPTYSGNPEDYKGVYSYNGPDAAEMAEGYGKKNGQLYKISYPARSIMRTEPIESNEFAFNRDIPSGRTSTPEDNLETKGIQEGLRDQFDQNQDSADELGKKIFYRDNKPDVGKRTGHQYDPGDVDTLFPWAETPWETQGSESSTVNSGDENISNEIDLGIEKAKAGKSENPFEHLDEFEGNLFDSAETFLRDFGVDPSKVDEMNPKELYKEAIDKGWDPHKAIQPVSKMIQDLPNSLSGDSRLISPGPEPNQFDISGVDPDVQKLRKMYGSGPKKE